MLYLSSLLIEEKQIETFDELLDVIKLRAKGGEIFFRIDLKPTILGYTRKLGR